jgi:sugar O-acyltransferase (sialic acid O-acetyltransferase NeuD family)
MTKVDLILVGAGGHSRSCIDTIEQEGKYRIAGIVGTSTEIGSKLFGYEVLASDLELKILAREFPNAFVALGQILSAAPRIRLYEKCVAAGFQLPKIISPSAYVSPHATIGSGSIVMHGAIINSGAQVGKNCIINNRALLDHDSKVSDYCHISTGAILNGGTSIGSASFIGSGSIIKEGVSVGEGSLVGMGVVVRHDIGSGIKFLGRNKI